MIWMASCVFNEDLFTSPFITPLQVIINPTPSIDKSAFSWLCPWAVWIIVNAALEFSVWRQFLGHVSLFYSNGTAWSSCLLYQVLRPLVHKPYKYCPVIMVHHGTFGIALILHPIILDSQHNFRLILVCFRNVQRKVSGCIFTWRLLVWLTPNTYVLRTCKRLTLLYSSIWNLLVPPPIMLCHLPAVFNEHLMMASLPISSAKDCLFISKLTIF